MATHAPFDTFDVLPTDFETIFELSDMDQVLPGSHTTACLVFSLSAESPPKRQIINYLRTGLQNVLTHIPLVGGQIHVTASRLSILRRHQQPIQLNVHHLDSDLTFPSYKTVADARFDPEIFSNNLLLLTPPDSNLTGFRRDEGCPVAVFQANFIRGGLILTLALHHQCGDAKSIDHLFSLWATSAKAAAEGALMPTWKPSLDRSYFNAHVTPTAAETEELKKNVHGFTFHPINEAQAQIAQAAASRSDSPAAPENSIRMFHFSTASSVKLKEVCEPAEPDKFVSSYDCIAALTWRCMTRARVPYLKMDIEKAKTEYAHPVDSRGKFSERVPQEYFGNGFIVAVSENLSIGTLIGEGGLQKAAQAIRQSTLDLNRDSIPDHVRVRKGIEGREEIRWNWQPQNVIGSSWMGMQVFQKYDFGFGLPASIRTPVPPFDGVIGMLPAAGVDGKSNGVDVYIVMENGCQERLREDAEYRAYCSPLDGN